MPTLELLVEREPSNLGATLGKMYHLQGISKTYVCDTLEDEVRELPGVPVEMWKVHGVTAIPRGRYRVALENSTRFGVDTITLLDVPGYKYIRGHGGNTAANTEGCLIFGKRNSANTVAGAVTAGILAKVKSLVRTALQAGDQVWITIQ